MIPLHATDYELEPCDGCSRGTTEVVAWDGRRMCSRCKLEEMIFRGWTSPPKDFEANERARVDEARQRQARAKAEAEAKAALEERALKEKQLAKELRKRHKGGPTLFQ